MRAFKRLVTTLLIIIMAASFFSGCNGRKEVYDYDVLGLGELPVGLWVTPPNEYQTDEHYRHMRESGINFVNGFYETTDENILAALNLSEKFGMKYLVNQRELEENIRKYKEEPSASLIEESMQFIEKFASHPAYGGQMFIDEPGKQLFSTINEFVKAYEQKYPGYQWHVNMLPTYGRGIGATSYRDYVDSWMELVNPNYYSYDSYPCLEYDKNSFNVRYEIDDYYYNLDFLRSKTLERGIPLWSFIQSTAIHGSVMEVDKRTPSREDIRWQVFSNLAFGVKGIQYFCYWTSINTTFPDDFAMISPVGERTERYYTVQEVNEEFKEYGKILLKSNADGVMLNKKAGDTRFELYEESLIKFGPVTDISGDTFIAGCFTDQSTGKKSMLITGCTPRDDITANLYVNKKVKQVSAYVNGQKTTIAAENGVITLEIKAGDAVFLQFG